MPATDWARHQRIHQYLGGQNVTYGGDTINIDQDYLDVQRPALAGGGAQASPAAAQPSAMTSVPGTVAVFAKGTDGRLWEAVSRPGSGGVRPGCADRVLDGPGRAALGYPPQAPLPLDTSG